MISAVSSRGRYVSSCSDSFPADAAMTRLQTIDTITPIVSVDSAGSGHEELTYSSATMEPTRSATPGSRRTSMTA